MATDPDHIRRALALWEDFPVHRVPRPVVFTAPPKPVPPRVTPDGLRSHSAWDDAPSVAESELTAEQREAAHRHFREHPLVRIVRAQARLGTDRGEQHLPALVLLSDGDVPAFITPDPEFERTMSWRPPGLTDPIHGTRATLAPDGQTLTVYYTVIVHRPPRTASAEAAATKAEAAATETETAILVGAVEDWQHPPRRPYIGFLRPRSTVVRLAAPLGNRVLIRLGCGIGTNSFGTPVPVTPDPAPAPPPQSPAVDAG